MATVKQALTSEQTLENDALNAARTALTDAVTREGAGKTGLALQRGKVADADANLAATREALANAEPADLVALKTQLIDREEASTAARTALLVQQLALRAAANDRAVATQRVTRASERVAEAKARLTDATAEAQRQSDLVALVGSAPVVANDAAVDTARTAIDAAFTALETALDNAHLVSAARLRRRLENLRRANAHDYADWARYTLDQLTPARVTSIPTVAATEGEYERARSRAAQFAAQSVAQVSQADAFFLQPVPLLSANARADLTAKAAVTANKNASKAEDDFVPLEIDLEIARHTLAVARLAKLIDPAVSVTAKETAYTTALNKRNLKVPTGAQFEALRVWRTAIPDDVKRYIGQLEDVSEMLDRLRTLYDADVAAQLVTADSDLAAAIRAAGEARRRADAVDDAVLAATLASAAADEQFSLMSVAVARGELADAAAIP